MKIAFLGSGNMASALSTKWHQKHQLCFAGRDIAKSAQLAKPFGAIAATADEAVKWADIVVIATPAAVAEQTLLNAAPADAYADKVIVDISNPVDPQTFVSTRKDKSSVTEAIEKLLPKAHVAKAFNMCHTSVWEQEDMTIGGKTLVTLYTASPGAKDTLQQLIGDVGAVPFHIGGNELAYQLEAAAAIVIKQLFSGAPMSTTLNLVRNASPSA
jgi:8-hydroxy-5-deazaflavin:NADPH oxidoreductase